PGQNDRSEGLVDLDHVDVVDGETGLLQRPLGGRDRRGEHEDRVGAAGGDVVDAGAGLQAVFLHRPLGGEQGGAGAVGDLAGHGGGRRAAFGEGGQRGHLLEAGLAGALVDPEVADGDDLVVEAAVLDGVAGAFVAAQRPFLHVAAGDVPLLGDHLGAAELGDLTGAVAVVPALGADERGVEAVFLAREHGSGDRDGAHVLHAGRDDHLGGAAATTHLIPQWIGTGCDGTESDPAASNQMSNQLSAGGTAWAGQSKQQLAPSCWGCCWWCPPPGPASRMPAPATACTPARSSGTLACSTSAT